MPIGRAHAALRRCQRIVSCGVAALVAGALLPMGVSHADPLPPPNPSDSQIQNAKNQATSASAEVGRLSAVMTATQATIQQLHDAMELKAELAMKAQVDVQLAQMAADDAKADSAKAQETATAAAGDITTAEDRAAEFAAASFRQGSAVGSMTALLDANSMDELLARQQMIVQVSANQAGVIQQLNTVRTQKANLDSKAKEAVQRAQEAQQATEDAKVVADQAWEAAQDSFAEGQQQLTTLQTQLAAQQQQYQDALNSVAGLQGQRQQYQVWAAAKAAEQARLEQQTAVQRDEADDLARERRAAEQLANEEASNRAVALKNEKKRQEKLRKEREAREAAEKLRKQREAEGLNPNDVQIPVGDGTRGQQVVQAALAYLGTTYAWGGGNAKGPTRGIRDYGIADRYGDYNKVGFDCSGLALYAWAQQGVYLPHYSGYQYNYGTRIGRNDLQPGDLVFYAYNTSNPRTIHHVAIYMGGGQMVEAPQSGDVVKISPMRWSGYIGATRPGV